MTPDWPTAGVDGWLSDGLGFLVREGDPAARPPVPRVRVGVTPPSRYEAAARDAASRSRHAPDYLMGCFLEPPLSLLDPPRTDARDYLAAGPRVRVTRPTDTSSVSRTTEPGSSLRFDEGDGEHAGAPVLEGRAAPYDEWTEINSRAEGHFMERIAPGALARSVIEDPAGIRLMLEHGFDGAIGRAAIGVFDELRDDRDGLYFQASLFGLPEMLMTGLRRGLYGSSIRFEPTRIDRRMSPRRSSDNPNGIPEVTVREARLHEISAVGFPAYHGATATARLR